MKIVYILEQTVIKTHMPCFKNSRVVEMKIKKYYNYRVT